MEITRDNAYVCSRCKKHLPQLVQDGDTLWYAVCPLGQCFVAKNIYGTTPQETLHNWNKRHGPWNYDKPTKSGWYLGMFYSEYDDQSQNEVYYDADSGEWVMDERHHKGDKLIGWQEKIQFISPFHIEDCCGCVPALSIWYPEYGEDRPASIECEWCCGNEVKLDVSIKDLTHAQRIELVNQWNNLEKKAGEE